METRVTVLGVMYATPGWAVMDTGKGNWSGSTKCKFRLRNKPLIYYESAAADRRRLEILCFTARFLKGFKLFFLDKGGGYGKRIIGNVSRRIMGIVSYIPLAAVALQNSSQNFLGCGLSGAVRPQEAENLPVLYGEVQTVEGLFVFAVGECQVFNLDHLSSPHFPR